ncbi:MAG: hypothetical protein R6X02_26460 [Enhygromyxa sp.]
MARRLASVVVVALLGCSNFEFEIPPASHINGTELIMVRHAVELGPLYPERAGPSFVGMDEAPIAEALPGDRVRLEAVVVEPDGRPIPAEELDTLWLQCGFSCVRPWLEFSDPLFDVPCSDLSDFTTRSICLLGSGDGRFEFEAPELGNVWWFDHSNMGANVLLYGVVAWHGRSAADCWASRRSDQAELDNCGFVYHRVPIGPYLPATIHAASVGIDSPVDPDTIPEWALWHPANRVPLPPALSVLTGGRRFEGEAPLPPIPIEPGASIDVALAFDPLSQSLQRTLKSLSKDNQAWKLVDERLFLQTATSGPLRLLEVHGPMLNDAAVALEVDPSAAPGSSRLLLIYSDERGAADFVSLEFEVR